MEHATLSELGSIILFTLVAGACIPVGGLVASLERIRPRWLESELRHSIIAFGGGILVAAVALVLVPEGTRYLDQPVVSATTVILGGVCFFMVESASGSKRREKPQLLAMLLDFLPESLALGGIFAAGSEAAPLLALFIGLQNLPEGFNAYRELLSGDQATPRKTLLMMTALVPLGPIFALIGYSFLSDHTPILGAIMLFASGGILYLIFQDIAPQSRMQRHWAPPLGAVLGFCIGMLGNNLAG
jgi:zinc transporter, ZIP family